MKTRIVDAGDLHRVLKGHEQAPKGALLGLPFQKILSLIKDRAPGHFIMRVSGQHLGQRAFSRAVGSHDGVYFSGSDLKMEILQDGLTLDTRVDAMDLQ
jgi:hypothetical protein